MVTAVDTSLNNATVRDVMHHGIVRCERSASLVTVARIMATHRIHAVVVSDDEPGSDGLWGVISDLDLVAAAFAGPLESQTAEASATSPLLRVTPGNPLRRALQLMTEHAATHLVVVDESDNQPVGILSSLDIATVVAA